MPEMKDFDLAFSGLKLGKHEFDYQLDNAFFSLFEYRDFERAWLRAKVELVKAENRLDLAIDVSGEVEVPCDVTNELFNLPVSGYWSTVIKFGESYDDSREELLILPYGTHKINLAQYLYETSALAVPLKRVSPEVQRGEKAQELRKKMEKPGREESEAIDPRWNKLKDLLN